ncbi:MAG: PAS domain-containing protein, partial [Methanocella sp.]
MKLFRLPAITEESRPRIIRLLGSLVFIAAITIAGLFVFEQLNIIFLNSLTVAHTHILTIFFGSALTTFAALIVLLQFDRLNAEMSRENEERRQAEKALVKSKAILSRAQVIAHIGNWAWDLKTGGMSWSDEIFKIFGYRPQEFQPSADWLLSKVVPEDLPLIETSLESALKENRLFNIDYRIVSSDGTVRYINMVADRIRRDRAGDPEWMYGITQDITRRKHIEVELQDAKAQAELYVDLMGHDINNMNQIGIG